MKRETVDFHPEKKKKMKLNQHLYQLTSVTELTSLNPVAYSSNGIITD